jgi:membrane-bound serine protease (ClpP class)
MSFSLNLLSFISVFPLAEGEQLKFGVICLIYLAGLLVLCVEMVAPGLFLGIVGLALIIVSIVLAFWHYPDKPMYGLSLLFISLIIVPSMAVYLLRKTTLSASQNLEEYNAANESFEQYVGKEGIAITILRPSGTAMVGGKRLDVTSENEFIEPNTPIKVVKFEGATLFVKTLEKQTL